MTKAEQREFTEEEKLALMEASSTLNGILGKYVDFQKSRIAELEETVRLAKEVIEMIESKAKLSKQHENELRSMRADYGNQLKKLAVDHRRERIREFIQDPKTQLIPKRNRRPADFVKDELRLRVSTKTIERDLTFLRQTLSVCLS